MSERFSEEQQRAIKEYYLQNHSGARGGNNALGEPLHEFNIFAEPPRRGAKNAMEKWMSDLPQVMETEMKSEGAIGVIIV